MPGPSAGLGEMKALLGSLAEAAPMLHLAHSRLHKWLGPSHPLMRRAELAVQSYTHST